MPEKLSPCLDYVLRLLIMVSLVTGHLPALPVHAGPPTAPPRQEPEPTPAPLGEPAATATVAPLPVKEAPVSSDQRIYLPLIFRDGVETSPSNATGTVLLAPTPSAAPAGQPIGRPGPPVGPPAEVQVSFKYAPGQRAGQPDRSFWVAVQVLDAQGYPVADKTEVQLDLSAGELADTRLQTRGGMAMTKGRLALGQATPPTLTVQAGSVQAVLTLDATAEESARSASYKGWRRGAYDGAETLAVARNRLHQTGTEAEHENLARRARFNVQGLRFDLKDNRAGGSSQSLGLELTEVRVGQTALLPKRWEMTVEDDWVFYRPAGETDPLWELAYAVGDETVQQYLRFEDLPAAGDLTIAGRFQTSLQPVFQSAEVGIHFMPPGNGRDNRLETLAYGPVLAIDAQGETLVLTPTLKNKQFEIQVPEAWLRRAEFPVVIDPVIGPAELATTLQGDARWPASASDGTNFLTAWYWNSDLYAQLSDGNGDPVGAIFPVTQAPNSQGGVEVLYNPVAGEYLVAWWDKRYGTGERALFARRVSPTGLLLGDEVQVSDLHPNLGQYGGIEGAVSEAGEVLLVWSHVENDYDVFGQLLDSGGQLSGGVITMTTVSQAQRRPEVAYDDQSDTFLVVWEDYQGGSEYDLYGQRLAAGGGLLGGPMLLVDSSGKDLQTPALAANDAGQFMLVWHKEESGGDYDIYGLPITAITGATGSVIDFGTGNSIDKNPAIVAVSATTYQVAWTENSHKLYVRQVGSDGSLLGSGAVQIGDGDEVVIAFDGSQSLVVWEDQLMAGQVLVVGRRLTAVGAADGAQFSLSPHYTLREPLESAYHAQSNHYLLTWPQAHAANEEDIFIQPLDTQGQQLGESLNLTTLPGSEQHQPALAAGSSDYLLVWEDRRTFAASEVDVYGQRVASDGTPLGGVISVTTASDYQDDPTVAFNSHSGAYLVAWHDYRNDATSGADITYQLVQADGSLGWSSPQYLNVANDQKHVAAAYNPDEQTTLLVFEDKRPGTSSSDLYGQVISADGSLLGSDFVIAAATGNQYYPAVAYSAAEQVYLAVWQDRRSGSYDIYGQVISGSGSLMGANFALSTAGGSQERPAVAARSGGSSAEFAVVWADGRSNYFRDIYLQRVDGSGNLLDEPETTAVETDPTLNFLIQGDNSRYFARPDIGYHAGEGVYLIAWTDRRDGGLYTRRYSPTPPAAPTAGFSATPTSGSYPLTVTFTNTSTGQLESAVWDFGDGSPLLADLTQAVTHTYTQSGTYTAVLTVSNQSSSDSASTLITVTEPTSGALSIDFSATPTAGTTPLTVTFTSLVTPTGSYSHTWDFGDGGTDNLAQPSHRYDVPGTYTVTLTVTGNGQTAVVTQPHLIFVADPYTMTIVEVTPAGGSLSSHDGLLKLTFAPGAVTETHQMAYAVGWRPQLVTNTVYTQTVIEPAPTGLPFHRFDLTSLTAGLPYTQHLYFSAPVTLTYHYAPEMARTYREESLRVVTYDETQAQWLTVPSTVNTQTMQVTAVLTHFSPFGFTGDAASWVVPTLETADVSLSNGSAQFSYPLAVPSGVSEATTPKLTLRYNSGLVNGSGNPGWLGQGWLLELGEIRGRHLTWNGLSERLIRDESGDTVIDGYGAQAYRTQRETFTKVYVVYAETVYWLVIDRQGTRYEFGRHPQSWLTGERHSGAKSVWKLNQVTDVHGNRMTIDYQRYPTNEEIRDQEYTYPTQIRYTYNNNNEQDNHAEYSIEFNTSKRGYPKNKDDEQQLDNVTIRYHPSLGVNQLIRRYTFNYTYRDESQGEHRYTLDQVQLTGEDDQSTLPAMTFSYEEKVTRTSWRGSRYNDDNQTWHSSGWSEYRADRYYLSGIDNGYGGQTTFVYQGAMRTKDSSPGPVHWHYVSERTITDDVSGQSVTYSYDYPNGPRQGDWRDEYFYSYFWGFDRVHVTAPAPFSYRSEHQFFINGEHDPRNGRELARYQFDVGSALYAATQSDWLEASGFVYSPETRQYQCNGQGSATDLSPCIAQTVTRSYDLSTGNLLSQEEHQGDNPTPGSLYRRTETTYFNQTGAPQNWLLGLPRRQLLQDSGGQVLAETLFYYDGAEANLGNPALPTLGNLTLQRVALDNQFVDARHQYNNRGRLTDQTVYNSYGTDTAIASGEARTTQTVYDGHGLLPVQVVPPLASHTIQTAYDYRFQAPTQVTDPNGQVTTTQLDPFGRVEAGILPGCAEATVSAVYGDGASPYYERAQQNIGVCGSPDYAQTTVYYDGLGRKIQAHSPGDDGNTTLVTHVAYDVLGRTAQTGVPYSVSGVPGNYLTPDWSSGTTQTAYDPLGRPLTITAPDNTLTRYQYDRDINFGGQPYNQTDLFRTVVFDANDHAKHQVSDTWGRLIRVREFSGDNGAEGSYSLYAETVYEYDERDNLTGVTDDAGNQTTLTYDDLGRKLTMDDPDMGLWDYDYDPLGNLTAQTDAQSQRTCFYYDTVNRVTDKAYPAPGATCPATPPSPVFAHYNYDQGQNGIGHRTGMVDLNGQSQVAWTYDVRGRLVSQSRTFHAPYDLLDNSPNEAYTFSYTYNEADWPLTTTYPDGETVSHSYTRRGLATTLTSSLSGGYVSGATYNALAQPTQRTSGNNLTTIWSYYSAQQANNRLQQVTVGGNLLDLSYQYDNVGNIDQMTDASAAVGGSQTLSFGYDHLDRLTGAVVSGATGVIPGYSHSYDTNEIGNITAQTLDGQARTYQYTDPLHAHAVTAVESDSYTYDANGNMTGRTEDGVTYTQDWTPFNKLERVTWEAQNQLYTTTFVYDGDGNRLLKIEQLPAPAGTAEITTLTLGGLYEKQVNTTSADLSGQVATVPIPPAVAVVGAQHAAPLPPHSTGKVLAAPLLQPITRTITLTETNDGVDIADERYEVKLDGDGLVFKHRKQGRVEEKETITFRLTQIQVGNTQLVPPGRLKVKPKRKNNERRAEYLHAAGIIEGYQALDGGVEQYFILPERPAASGDLTLVGQLKSPLTAEYQSDQEGIWFLDEQGKPVLRYSGVWVYDQLERGTFAQIKLSGNQITLTVPEDWLAEALYPVVIDPLIGDDFGIAVGPASQQGPELAYNSQTNEYLAVWREYVPASPSTWNIRTMRMDPDGTPKGNIISVQNTAANELLPAVAYNVNDNNYLIAWTEHIEGGSDRVRGQLVSASGAKVGSAFTISGNNTNQVDVHFEVIHNPDNGQYLIVWSQKNSGGIYNIYGRRVAGNGVPQGTNAFNIASSSSPEGAPKGVYNPQADEFLVVWHRNDSGILNVLARRIALDGQLQGSEIPIVSSSDQQVFPTVAHNSQDNSYLITWRDITATTSTIHGRRFAATGGAVGGAFTIANTGSTVQQHPQMAYHAVNNEYLVTWEECNAAACVRSYEQPFDIRGRRVGADGALLLDNGQSYVNLAVYAYGQFSQDVVYNTQDANFLVVWDDYRSGGTLGDGEIYGQRYAPPDETAPTGWSNLQPTGGWQTSLPVNVSVQVSDAYQGLDGSTAQVRYWSHGGNAWSAWQTATCSGCGAGPDNTATLSASLNGLGQGYYNWVQFRISDRATPANLATLDQYRVGVDTIPPTNPTIIDPGCTATDGAWQNTCNDPNFALHQASDAQSGLDGYEVYWGTSSTGTSPATWTASNTYDPPQVASGTPYYLRVRTKDRAGHWSAWETVYTFQYDGDPPTNPNSVNPNCPASDNVWQNTCSDPNFTWSGADDTTSGVAGYHVYFGPSNTGTSTTWTTTTGYDPTAVSGSGTYYLRLQTQDNAGNWSEWETHFIFRYDETPPTNPAAATIPNMLVLDNVWQSVENSANFDWTPGGNDAHSGIAGYQTPCAILIKGDQASEIKRRSSEL